ncbi:MAG: RagB/SusD family nutrient uptake outer membrane protein, partial [Ruminococcus flavefaciens]|nr:RagB/SusD family nutrient uptake outer membrane protein [Ruminococcus flavefaciens]
MKKIIPILVLPLLALTACELDYYPTNAMTSAQLADNPTSAVYSTDGNYSMFKDNLEYKGTTYSGNSYVRHYFQMSEFHGDCVALSHKTEDPLYNSMCYSDLITAQPNSYLWWCAYHIIYSANSIIESLPEGTSGTYDHILGENYFMRAICHLHLATLFAKPYSQGRENPGVILRTSTEGGATVRASVGAVYDQVRDDLIKAAELMAADESRVVNHGYISRDAALGLLSRVYLYRGENNLVIETVNGMLDGASALSKLDPDCETYFARALTSDETLWAVAHTQGTEDPVGRETIGSMYYTP